MGYHLRVKICGLTSAADIREAARLGFDAVGLNFHASSPRAISPETAATVLCDLPPFMTAVGIFVKKSVRDVWDLVGKLGRIRAIQIHGGSPEMVDAFPYHFIPAFAVRDKADRDGIVRYLDTCRLLERAPSAILVDGHDPALHGGTGKKAPWQLASGLGPWRATDPRGRSDAGKRRGRGPDRSALGRGRGERRGEQPGKEGQRTDAAVHRGLREAAAR